VTAQWQDHISPIRQRGERKSILQLEGLGEDCFRCILRMDSLIAAGMLPCAHVTFAVHLLAAGHLRLGHLAQIRGASYGWQQRPRKQDGGGKPTS
jgi:hypothetical protein